MKKITYLGPKGSFSEEAAEKYLQKQKLMGVIFNPVGSISAVVDSVKGLFLDNFAIVPIENSIEGIVTSTLDKLINEKENGIKIVGEIILQIKQCLLGLPGADINNIKEICSHSQAIAQCEKNIFKMFGYPTITLTESTSQGADIVSQKNDEQCAVLGNKKLKDIYGLKILKKTLNDNNNNTTRFLVIGKKETSQRATKNKTSIIFVTKNKPGALHDAIEVFKVLNINMTNLHSRPAKRFLGEYVFFVEVDGHQKDKNLSVALSALKTKVDFLKILGSYPKN